MSCRRHFSSSSLTELWPWRRRRPALGRKAGLRAPPDAWCTPPCPAVHRSAAPSPCWRGRVMTPRWWWRSLALAGRREYAEERRSNFPTYGKSRYYRFWWGKHHNLGVYWACTAAVWNRIAAPSDSSYGQENIYIRIQLHLDSGIENILKDYFCLSFSYNYSWITEQGKCLNNTVSLQLFLPIKDYWPVAIRPLGNPILLLADHLTVLWFSELQAQLI